MPSALSLENHVEDGVHLGQGVRAWRDVNVLDVAAHDGVDETA